MALPREIAFDECVRLLQAGIMGRVALTTPRGPQIVPVNYAAVEESILVATSPYSALGTYGPQQLVAFEVDHFDYESHTGWSVQVQGRAEVVSDPAEVRRLRQIWAPRPWAEGSRNLHLRIPWTELSGRTVGNNLSTPVQRVVGAP
jgi:nitroimidazol reductase NimA-like FMN-containing flavoprotein (pyridoxamine 5'-phosphate oxidase superfamily)